MRVRSLLLVLALAPASGCVGLDLDEFDREAMASLLDESGASSLDGEPEAAPGPGPDPSEGPVGRDEAPSDVGQIDAGDAPRDNAVIRASAPAEAPPTDLISRVEVEVDGPSPTDAQGLDADEVPDEDLLAEAMADEGRSAKRGVVVATVGGDRITLPEVTRAVKGRIARLPGGRSPNRRQVIGLVRSEMQARILESLVRQQAEAVVPDERERRALFEAIDREWSGSELPRILDREGLDDPEALDGRLAGRGQSLDDLRVAFASRALARELIRREGLAGTDVDAYLDRIRERFPIDSDFLPAG